MKKYKGIIIAAVIICLLALIGNACDGDRYSMDGPDWGANFDWGDGYYWNSNSHSVEKTIW